MIDTHLKRNRYQLPLILAGWGVWIYVFDSFEYARAFSAMMWYGTELQWGALFVTIGVAGYVTAKLGVRYPTRQWAFVAQLLGAAGVATAWFFIFLLLAMGNVRSTATYIYGVMCLMSLINFVDLSNILEINK